MADLTIGQWIHKERLDREWSAEQFSEAVVKAGGRPVGISFLSQIENDVQLPHPLTICAIAYIFNYSIEALFTEIEGQKAVTSQKRLSEKNAFWLRRWKNQQGVNDD